MDDYPPRPRLLRERVEKGLRMSPVVVIGGARQAGKTTLARSLDTGHERSYVTLDHPDSLAQALHSPDRLIPPGGRITIDEVQRAPRLLHAIKIAVDEHRVAGRFLLTGSANLLLLRTVSESLAGRVVHCGMWPMTRREALGLGTAGTWTDLLKEPPRRWPDLLHASPPPMEDWRALARRGGYPVPALALADPEERALWHDGYVATYLERDLRDISAVSSLPDYRNLMEAACLRIGGLVNISDLARDVKIPPTTARRYLDLLETTYQLVRVHGFTENRTLRLIKAPKLYWSDTGLALHLSREQEPRGHHLENLVLCDLSAWSSNRPVPPTVMHWRTASGIEVDFVVEDRRHLLPIEVKSTARPRYADARGLEAFLDAYPDRATGGLLLHDGAEVSWLSKRVVAAPWWMVI